MINSALYYDILTFGILTSGILTFGTFAILPFWHVAILVFCYFGIFTFLHLAFGILPFGRQSQRLNFTLQSRKIFEK
jgi:hypothetical protein